MRCDTPEVADSSFGALTPEAAHVLNCKYNLVEGNGLRFFVDSNEHANVPSGMQRVYPFMDEAGDLLKLAREVVAADIRPFVRAIDCFAGGGHSVLPILQEGIAQRGFGIDMNPRAVALATNNAQLNGLDRRATFLMEDVHNLDEMIIESSDRTLFIANPPFALTTQGQWDTDGLPGNAADEHLMRAGGRDGLTLTRAYITHALAKVCAQKAMEHSKEDDVIIGVAYSRIGTDGRIELESELQSIIGDRGSYSIELVQGATLWRGPNGQKEQPNPMPLTNMKVKGVNKEQKDEYDQAAKSHLQEGYDRLGYYRYIIRIGQAEGVQNSTRTRTQELLA